MSELTPAQLAPYVAGGAFLLAFVFGAVANKTDFCTMGAVSDWVNMGDFNRMLEQIETGQGIIIARPVLRGNTGGLGLVVATAQFG